jgi:SET domain-containing protein
MSTPFDSLLRGLYPKSALLAHDCVGNSTISVDSTFNLRIHASLDIKAGEVIYYNYTNALYVSFNEI